jgi:hypothetical protein
LRVRAGAHVADGVTSRREPPLKTADRANAGGGSDSVIRASAADPTA